jgi:tryptophan synthase alpha chain
MMKKLVAYLTTAFPDKNFTIDAILSLKEVGVDKIELGIPFSDPVADGPVIEKANLIALQNGFKIEDVFEVSKRVASQIDTYWMGYFNSFYHKEYDFMVKQAKESGVKGFIIPDLPYEETEIYKDKLPLISFVAPTDTSKRIETILQNSQEFIYMVAYAGITGSDKKEDLSKIISDIRKVSDTPIYIGFGVNEKTAKEKSKNVDGVIVGSAFINVLLENITYSEKIKKISQIAKNIKERIN